MSTSTINFPFTPASNDQSIYYLGRIFGNVGNVLVPSSGASQVLGAMFQTFNSVVLGVGTIIVLYVTVVGLLKTAQEGQFLGQQWNNIWIPLRMVLGIAAVVPTPSGYCSIQIIVMWIVIQGVAAGDMIWNRVLGYTDKFGSPLSSITIPSVGVGNNVQTLFQSLVCQETALAAYSQGVPANTFGYYCASSTPDNSFCGQQVTDITQRVTQSQQTYQLPSQQQAGQPAQTSTQTVTLNTWKIGPNGNCGTMTYCINDSACNDTSKVTNQIRCSACTAQKDALQSIVTALSTIAQRFVQVDYEYRSFWGNPTEPPSWVSSYCSSIGIGGKQCCPGGVTGLPGFPTESTDGGTPADCKISPAFNPGPDNNALPDTVLQVYWPFAIQPETTDVNFLTASASNYIAALQEVVTDIINNASSSTSYTSSSKDQLTQAQSVGWIFAGAFYYFLALGNNSNYQASMPPWTVVGVDPATDPNNPLYRYRNNFQAAGKLAAMLAQQGQTNSAGPSPTPPQLQDLNKLTDGLASSASDIMNIFYTIISGAKAGQNPPNPLIALQGLGKALLIVAQILFALIMVVIPALTLLGYFNMFVLGTGVDNPIGPTVTTLAIIFAPLIAIFLGSLFTFGALLAVYVPLIPYVVFTMGAIAWLILVIEAMIASPIAALGILSPSAHHELLGKAADSLMYVFSIFLRPALMIFGLVAAMLLSIVVVTMINAAFTGVMGQIYQNPGLVEILLFLGAYVSLVLIALNKCFSLIHVVPDRVLRWIGGHAEAPGGEAAQEGMQATKGGVSGAAGGAAAIGAGMKARGADFNRMAQEKAAAAKAKKEGGLAPTLKADTEAPESKGGEEGGGGGGASAGGGGKTGGGGGKT